MAGLILAGAPLWPCLSIVHVRLPPATEFRVWVGLNPPIVNTINAPAATIWFVTIAMVVAFEIETTGVPMAALSTVIAI